MLGAGTQVCLMLKSCRGLPSHTSRNAVGSSMAGTVNCFAFTLRNKVKVNRCGQSPVETLLEMGPTLPIRGHQFVLFSDPGKYPLTPVTWGKMTGLRCSVQRAELTAAICSLSIFHEECMLQELTALATKNRRENDQMQRRTL